MDTNNNEMFKNYPDILTVNEMLQILRIGRNQAYELLKNREILSYGKPHRILKSSVITYIKKNLGIFQSNCQESGNN